MIKDKHSKKDPKKRVHCSRNKIKLPNPLVCDWCLQGDKRKDGFFHNCCSYYFHLLYCAKNTNFPLNPTLEEKQKELQTISDQILEEVK